MKKLSVSEYATAFKVSVQSVYQKIKRGTLKSVEENGIKYVFIEEEAVKEGFKDNKGLDCKDLLKIIKSQSKEIKRLTKELTNAIKETKNEEIQTLKAYIGEIKQLTAPQTVKDDFIDLEEVKTKKKKKKKKKKY